MALKGLRAIAFHLGRQVVVDDISIAVGGQTGCEEGPSALFTIYHGNEALLEIQVPFEAALAHAHTIEARTRSWMKKSEEEQP